MIHLVNKLLIVAPNAYTAKTNAGTNKAHEINKKWPDAKSALEAYTLISLLASHVLYAWLQFIAIQSSMLSKMAGSWAIASCMHDLEHYIAIHIAI